MLSQHHNIVRSPFYIFTFLCLHISSYFRNIMWHSFFTPSYLPILMPLHHIFYRVFSSAYFYIFTTFLLLHNFISLHYHTLTASIALYFYIFITSWFHTFQAFKYWYFHNFIISHRYIFAPSYLFLQNITETFLKKNVFLFNRKRAIVLSVFFLFLFIKVIYKEYRSYKLRVERQSWSKNYSTGREDASCENTTETRRALVALSA